MPTILSWVGFYYPHITEEESSGNFGDSPPVAKQEVTEQDADLKTYTLATGSQHSNRINEGTSKLPVPGPLPRPAESAHRAR